MYLKVRSRKYKSLYFHSSRCPCVRGHASPNVVQRVPSSSQDPHQSSSSRMNIHLLSTALVLLGQRALTCPVQKVRASMDGLSEAVTSPRSSITSNLIHIRGGMCTSTKRTGTSYLPPSAVERAAAGNMFEKAKLKRDPSLIWTDIEDWAAAIRAGTTNWEDIASEDIDLRAKYAGLFHRKKATPGKFMMRLRIPNGILHSGHMRFYADTVRKYGPEIGVVDITTRMNIQLRGMPIEDGADILKGLQALGQTSVMSGLDNLRNLVGSPIAGIDPLEMIDTRDLCRTIDSWYSNGGVGNAEWCNMPRKFNIAISGSRDDFAHTHINDIGFQPCSHEKTGEIGFNVVLGGYFSIKRIAEAIPMDVWVNPAHVVPLSQVILKLFRHKIRHFIYAFDGIYRDFGGRGDRQKARLMWLIEEMGIEKFRRLVEEEMRAYVPEFTFEVSQKHLNSWGKGCRNLLGVHSQKQEGFSWVGIHVPVGRLSADECVAIADLADKYSNGEIRLTVDQNFLLPNVNNRMIDALLSEPVLGQGQRLSVNPGNIIGGIVSCTGSQFCPLALVETKGSIDNLARKLQASLEVPRPIRIHMTGCPNSCGQAQLADIGLMGAPAKKADETGVIKAVPGVNIYIGGKIGENAHLSTDPVVKGVPLTEEDLLPVLTNLLIEKFEATRR